MDKTMTIGLQAIYEEHKNFEEIAKRKSAQDRIKLLKDLKEKILKYRSEILQAIHNDFKKPYAESELTEIHTTLDEINFACKNLKKWMKDKRVSTPLTLLGSKSYLHYEALGTVLILAPWNYPFSLVMHPLIAALAAGNCVMIKPSEKTSNVSLIIKKIIEEVFDPKHVSVILGEVDVANALLDLKFDHIFFTGSSNVGKIVMKKASEHLTPVTLELGGKSPVIVDKEVDLDDCINKLTWGKFINAGQTCVAPDYVFVHEKIKKEFIAKFNAEIKRKFGTSVALQKESKDFARIIDLRSFKRIKGLIAQSDIEKLNDLDEAQLFIPPMLLEHSEKSDAIMQEEIFGPVLPVISYGDIKEVTDYIKSNQKPLALYIFSKNNSFINHLISNTSSGGVGVNHVIMHLANTHLPFGGVGYSGMGSYHGQFGFKTFSHERAILKQGPLTLTGLYFQPYSGKLSELCFKLLKILE